MSDQQPEPDITPDYGKVADPDDLLDGCPSQDAIEEPDAPSDVDS